MRDEAANTTQGDAREHMSQQRARRMFYDLSPGELDNVGQAFGEVIRARQSGGVKQAMPDMQSTRGDSAGPSRPAITIENVDDCFTYHAPNGCTLDAMSQVREASIAMAKAILRTVPDCPDRTTALRKLREARMWANSALALGGRF